MQRTSWTHGIVRGHALSRRRMTVTVACGSHPHLRPMHVRRCPCLPHNAWLHRLCASMAIAAATNASTAAATPRDCLLRVYPPSPAAGTPVTSAGLLFTFPSCLVYTTQALAARRFLHPPLGAAFSLIPHPGGEVHAQPHTAHHPDLEQRQRAHQDGGPDKSAEQVREPPLAQWPSFPTLDNAAHNVMDANSFMRVFRRRGPHPVRVLQQARRAVHGGGSLLLSIGSIEVKQRAPVLCGVDLISESLRVLQQRRGTAVRRLVRNVSKGLERRRRHHPVRGPVHSGKRIPRPHPRQHHHPRWVVPLAHLVTHRSIANKAQCGASRAAALKKVHSFFRGPSSHVRHHRPLWVARR
mmetsp:Transcript_3861/g.9357  ORF Transcript_3861/g.9357 Transcript_3861/m.9357 type:complete len:353 (-) Transcript_3861:886-1944(-)